MKTLNTNFSDFSNHYFLRNDVKYWKNDKSNNNLKLVRFKDIFNIINGICCTEYYSQEKTNIPYIRVADLTFKDEIKDDDLIYFI